MTEVHVERLALRVSGLDEGAARELAHLVATGLADSLLRTAPDAGVPGLRVQLTTPAPGTPAGDTPAGDPPAPDALARRIVDAVGRTLARDRAAGGPDGEAAA
jgi:hypothetical protein